MRFACLLNGREGTARQSAPPLGGHECRKLSVYRPIALYTPSRLRSRASPAAYLLAEPPPAVAYLSVHSLAVASAFFWSRFHSSCTVGAWARAAKGQQTHGRRSTRGQPAAHPGIVTALQVAGDDTPRVSATQVAHTLCRARTAMEVSSGSSTLGADMSACRRVGCEARFMADQAVTKVPTRQRSQPRSPQAHTTREALAAPPPPHLDGEQYVPDLQRGRPARAHAAGERQQGVVESIAV
jgi:hypothetical protein